MNTVKVTTSQNVQLDYAVAGVAERIIAALIDYTILFFYIIGMSYLLPSLGIDDGIAIYILLIALPFFTYDLLFEIFLGGQTLGKKALKIKAVKLDGSQPDIGSYLLRWLLRMVECLPTFGTVAMVSILASGKGQRLGDLAAATTVIRTKETVTLQDTILTEIDENYEPKFVQVSALTDEDIAVIKDVIDNRIEDTKTANHLAYKAKLAVETKIGVKSDMLPLPFLETVLKDYNTTFAR